MRYKLYWESRYLRRWKLCGEFSTFNEADNTVNYLIKHLPWGYKVKFRITSDTNSYHLSGLGLAAQGL